MKTDKQKAIDKARRATGKWYVHVVMEDRRNRTYDFEHLHEANDFYNGLPAITGAELVADITRNPNHPGTGRKIDEFINGI